jgi:hypothetical protein
MCAIKTEMVRIVAWKAVTRDNTRDLLETSMLAKNTNALLIIVALVFCFPLPG